MSLHLSILEEDDIPSFARVDEAAMAGWPLAEAMSINSTVPRRELVEGWVRKGFQTDSTQTYLKVTDTETKEIIACALWRIDPDGKHEKPKREVPAPVEGEGADGTGKVEGDDGKEARLGSVMDAMAAGWKQFQAQFFADTPHASTSIPFTSSTTSNPQPPKTAFTDLQILITDPAHQRRGAGSMLVKWGCERADERGLISVLTASEAGLKVYLNHGFEVVRDYELDLTPYGLAKIERRRNMIRQPRSKV